MLWFILFRFGVADIDPRFKQIPILFFALGSVLLGTVIAMFVGKRIIRPLQNFSKAFDELSKGNFHIKVSEDEAIMEIREMAQRFNAMVYDLSHIETLRSDFVANVSHEFKTPIAAIEGYATLLQNHGLPPEKQDRYIEKILDNSRRLSRLPKYSLSCRPQAMRPAARVILRVTKFSPRRSDSWLNRMPLQAYMP